MFHSKISCNVEDSLAKIYDYGVYQAMKIDFHAIVTITQYSKVKIEGIKSYRKDTSSDSIFIILDNLIKNNIDKLSNLDQSLLFTDMHMNDEYDIIFSPIRYYDNYYVYSVLGKKNGDLSEAELKITDFITKVTYENLLLDYKIIEERNYLKNIFNSTTSFIITLDLDYNIISINKNLSDKLDNGENYIGKNIGNFLEESYFEKAKLLINRVIEEKITIPGEEEFKNIGGEKKFYINYSISPMIDIDSNVIGIVAFGNDISMQKIYERENEQLKQYALLGEISTEIAHEIKNPLMGIRGITKLLAKKNEDTTQQSYLESTVECVDRINFIIEQMLSYSRITTEIDSGFIDINKVITQCIHAVFLHKEAKYITINKDFADNLPCLKTSVTKIQQIFMNILLNAVQSIERQGTINIRTKKLEDSKEIEISVEDTGIGISDNKKIFEPFYTTKKDGTGLGLSIIDKVIKELNGHYRVNSKVNIGTIFDVRLPYDEVNFKFYNKH